MAIYMTAQWQCQKGAEERVVRALEAFVAAVRDNEPQTRVYTAFQAKEEPTRFLTHFIFESEAARAAHRETEWVKRFVGEIYPHNVGDVTFTEYELIVSTKP